MVSPAAMCVETGPRRRDASELGIKQLAVHAIQAGERTCSSNGLQ